jgi:4-hydroxybenzoate polyprenyltransferase
MPANAVGKARSQVTAASAGEQLRLLVDVMRPHQWLKNLFVFAPVAFSRKLDDIIAVQQAMVACVAFCLMASSLYIINDIIDAQADRSHPEKRRRPIASGALPIETAIGCSFVLLGLSISIASTLGWAFLGLAALYFTLTIAYCIAFKRTIILDCILIASGFVLRVVGGAVAVNVGASHWLVVCTFLLALYLAFSKRRQELLILHDTAFQHRRVLGEYTVPYLDQVNTILLSAVIVCYALYTVAPETVARFGTDALIYGTVFVLYALLRYLVLILDPANGGDPGKLLLRDRPLMASIVAWVGYNTAVIYWADLMRMWGF